MGKTSYKEKETTKRGNSRNNLHTHLPQTPERLYLRSCKGILREVPIILLVALRQGVTWKPVFGKCFTANSFSFALLIKSLRRKRFLRHRPQCKSGSMSFRAMGVLRFLLSLGSQYLPSPVLDLNRNMSFHAAVLMWKKTLKHEYLFRKLFPWVDKQPSPDSLPSLYAPCQTIRQSAIKAELYTTS